MYVYDVQAYLKFQTTDIAPPVDYNSGWGASDDIAEQLDIGVQDVSTKNPVAPQTSGEETFTDIQNNLGDFGSGWGTDNDILELLDTEVQAGSERDLNPAPKSTKELFAGVEDKIDDFGSGWGTNDDLLDLLDTEIQDNPEEELQVLDNNDGTDLVADRTTRESVTGTETWTVSSQIPC